MAAPKSTLQEALTGHRIPGLDFLRALAVLLVLADHSGVGEIKGLSWVNGGIGVEIFFVLSGFLITWLLSAELDRRQTIRLRDFYQRRIARLMPVFYLYVLMGLIILTVRNKPIPWDAVFASMAYVINYYQAFTGAPTHFLSHCWSLAVEEQFYFLWPFLMLWAYRKRWSMLHVLLMLIASIWVYRACMWLIVGASDEYMYRGLDTRADHLLGGCLLAVILRQPAHLTLISRWAEQRRWLAWVLLAGILLSGAFHGNRAYRYVFGYGLETVFTALLLPFVVVHAHSSRSWLAKLMNARLVVAMGQASYGIYLFHQLFLHVIRNGVEHRTGSFALSFAVAVGAVFLMAHVSYTRFESPLRERLQPRRATTPPAAALERKA